MKFLARLAAGDVALWRAFWLIGTPLAVVWDVSGGCTLVGCGIDEPSVAGFLLLLFTLSSVALVFAAVAIWRSASKYPRQVWWQRLLALGAKTCAALSGLAAAVSVLVVLYIVGIFIYAAFDHA
jgi:hypothetical protein